MPTKSAERAAETMARILEAAIVVFARQGFRQSCMDQIAEQAGLSRQALYNHVPSKEALFAAAVEALQQRSLTAAETAITAARATRLAAPALLTTVIQARLHYFQEALRGSQHMAELNDEQCRQCGPIIAPHQERFRNLLIGLVHDERHAGRLDLKQSIANSELADDAYSVAKGLVYTFPNATSAEFRERLERILTRMIDGARA